MTLGWGGELLKILDDGDNRSVDAALDLHWVVSSGNELGTLFVDGLSENGCGGCAIACVVGGLGSNFLNHLCAHVLELVLKLDLFGNRYTIFGDRW